MHAMRVNAQFYGVWKSGDSPAAQGLGGTPLPYRRKEKGAMKAPRPEQLKACS
jgi:hypothetical protein